ncbi:MULTISPECIES: penicillin-binding transpeptidase domain-containing protein [unclassified Saccharopolyspora]|uniref:penicillin-binding transpeptidase domain-containing protein n=1 Tax=unclassified Saccharopolyspora TaxID=2646250 RepID=UPI0027E0EBE0|nr:MULTISPECIES: penicillin-binding transpeptidase domain-containing protein [unclassified Saccharopolyspora]
MRSSRIFPQRRPRARLLAACTGLAMTLPVSGCGLFDSGPSAQEVATAFLNTVAAGDTAGAAGRTDAPEKARQALDDARGELSPRAINFNVTQVVEDEGGAPARATFDANWDLGDGRAWQYRGALELSESDQGWKVHWAPSVLHPKLADGQRLAFDEQRPEPQPVLDREGTELMRPEQIVTVTLDPQAAGDLPGVAEQLAAGLQPVDPEITRQTIVDGVNATEAGQPYVVVSLRQDDYDRVRPAIYDLPGVRFPAQTKLVAEERGYAAQALSGVSEQVDEQITANAGWNVHTADANGAPIEVLQEQPIRPVDQVRTTLSDRTQRAAEQALDPVPQAAMIVAMQPSTGDVLAVAQNDPADAQGAPALTGQFPPGSTFKIMTAAAGLEAGKVTVDQPVECPASKVFDGRTIPNDKDFDLGVVPLRTAFAKSCNTTFAQLAVDLPAQALTDMAKRLGIGVDFDVPGITTITGQAPPGENTTGRAANGFGQGTVLTSPFGMALASATVANGSMPIPKLIEGAETKADSQVAPLSPQVLDQLRPMMREVVLSGTATAVAGEGEVAGKTGTAQFGDGTHSHGWFVGYRDDLAFAVLLEDSGESKPAVQVAQSFLSNVP